jgi:hypothetical protein
MVRNVDKMHMFERKRLVQCGAAPIDCVFPHKVLALDSILQIWLAIVNGRLDGIQPFPLLFSYLTCFTQVVVVF